VLDGGEVLREEVINDDALCRWPGVAIEVDAREQTVDVGEHLGCVVPAELPARVAQAIGVSVVWRAAAAGGPALPPWVLIANLARLVICLGRWSAQHPVCAGPAVVEPDDPVAELGLGDQVEPVGLGDVVEQPGYIARNVGLFDLPD
jgi:hypothetical protein